MADDLIAQCEARAELDRDYGYKTRGDLWQSVAFALAARDEEIRLLREALERLGSMEAFVSSRMIDKRRDEELLARIHYARAALTQPTA